MSPLTSWEAKMYVSVKLTCLGAVIMHACKVFLCKAEKKSE